MQNYSPIKLSEAKMNNEFEAFTDETFELARNLVLLANKIPSDLPFYTSSYPLDIGKHVEIARKSILNSINNLTEIARRQEDEKIERFVDAEDFVDRYDSVWVETLDSIFERVVCLIFIIIAELLLEYKL